MELSNHEQTNRERDRRSFIISLNNFDNGIERHIKSWTEKEEGGNKGAISIWTPQKEVWVKGHKHTIIRHQPDSHKIEPQSKPFTNAGYKGNFRIQNNQPFKTDKKLKIVVIY